MSVIFILAGLILLYFGAEWLVKGSSSVALALGVKPLIVGLTIVAFGTSSPELLVSIQAGLDGVGDIAIGNVIGSNICNIGLILGISAMINPINIRKEVFQFDLPLLLIISGGMIWVMLSGTITFANGIFLTSGLLLYLVLSFWRSKRSHTDVLADIPVDKRSDIRGILKNTLLIVLGLLFLALGSWSLVTGAVTLAEWLGMSTAVIGLTVVALGTSVPELAASVVASLKKHADFVVGGVIGSNIFNILCILGITSLIVPLEMGDVSQIDIIVMIAFTVIILPFMRTGFSISRLEGLLLVLAYFAYTTYLIY